VHCTERKHVARGLSRLAETADFYWELFSKAVWAATKAFVFTVVVIVVRGENNRRGQTSGPLHSLPVRRRIYRGEKTADDLREETDSARETKPLCKRVKYALTNISSSPHVHVCECVSTFTQHAHKKKVLLYGQTITLTHTHVYKSYFYRSLREQRKKIHIRGARGYILR